MIEREGRGRKTYDGSVILDADGTNDISRCFEQSTEEHNDEIIRFVADDGEVEDICHRDEVEDSECDCEREGAFIEPDGVWVRVPVFQNSLGDAFSF